MKAQTKALIASVVVIALALSAVSGITYSWWSDSESTDITVNTGYVDVKTDNFSIKKGSATIYSGSGVEIPDSIGITYSDTESDTRWYSDSKSLVVTGNPGDTITISYTATFTWTVAAKFTMGYGSTSEALKTNTSMIIATDGTLSAEPNGWVTPSDSNSNAGYTVTVTINGLPAGLSNAELQINNYITQAKNPISIWDGSSTAVTPSTEEGTTVYKVSTASELAWIAQKTNSDPSTFSGKTVTLMNDLDLNGIEWTPIGITSNTEFRGTFDGQNHTIRGLNVQTPMGTTDDWVASGLFGWLGNNGSGMAAVKDLNIDGATISGQCYVGGIAGYLQFGSITGCTVKNSVLTNSYDSTNDDRSGDKTGGIVGFIAPNGSYASAIGNTVENISLIGCRDIGCVAGVVYNGNIFTNNTVAGQNTITVDQTSMDTVKAPNANYIVGYNPLNASWSPDSSNTVTGTVTITAKVKTSDQLNMMLRQNWTDANIILPSGNYILSGASGDVNIHFGGTISGVSSTILDFSGVTQVSEGGHLLYDRGKSLAFENIQLKVGSNNYTGFVCDKIFFTNCTIEGQLTLFSEKASFTSCLFILSSSEYLWTYGAQEVTISNCIFNTIGKAILIYNENQNAGTRANIVSVTGCTFNSSAGAKAGAISNQNCAAIEIDNYGWGVTLTTSGNTVDTTSGHFSGEWRIKNYTADTTVDHPVSVNGTVYTTTAIDGKMMVVESSNVVSIDGQTYSSS